MPSDTTKPTILMVHGSWHTPKFYKRQLDLFEKHGFPTSCPMQPSVGKLPPIGLLEDAQTIRDELTRLVETEGREVIVIGHSYGGIVSSQAVDAAFGRQQRAEQGKPGGVVHLLFAAAFVVPLHMSLGMMLGSPDTLPPFIPIDDRGMCVMLEPERRFYNDLPEAEQKEWAAQLVECPAQAQMTPITQAAYTYLPVTYLFCDNDEALPVAVQEQMVAATEAAIGRTFGHERCSAGHSPFLSQPEVMLKVVEKISTAAA